MKSLLMVLMFSLGICTIACAHETVKAGAVTLFTHIDPGEPATVGVPATLFISLTNTEKSFAIKDCDCTLSIVHDENVLMNIPLEASDDPDTFGIAGVPVTFVTAGTYDLTVIGTPTNSATFKAFTVDSDITVAPMGTTTMPSGHGHGGGHTSPLHVLHLAILFGGIGASTVVIYRERKEIFKKK